VKEQQFADAINTALGVELQAIASRLESLNRVDRWRGSRRRSPMGPVVPGQRIDVRVALTNRGTTISSRRT